MRISFILYIAFIVCSTSCKSSKEVSSAELLDQIELNLADKMNPKRIEMGFASLGIKYLCTLNEAENLCVFSFDTTIKSLEEILNFMGNEVGVESASITKGCTNE